MIWHWQRAIRAYIGRSWAIAIQKLNKKEWSGLELLYNTPELTQYDSESRTSQYLWDTGGLNKLLQQKPKCDRWPKVYLSFVLSWMVDCYTHREGLQSDSPTPASNLRSNMSLTVQAELLTMKAALQHFNRSKKYASVGRYDLYAAIVNPQAVKHDCQERFDAPWTVNVTERPKYQNHSSRLLKYDCKRRSREEWCPFPTFSSLINSRYGRTRSDTRPSGNFKGTWWERRAMVSWLIVRPMILKSI